MDEIKTTRNTELNFTLVFPETYFGSGKYPTLRNERKTPINKDQLINFRILPEETSDDVLKHIDKVVADKRVKIIPLEEGKSEPAPVSPSNVKGFLNIFTTLRQVYPEAAVAPTMMLGSSDSKYFIVVTKNIYRFAPIVVNAEGMARIHGLNERTSMEDFKRGIGFYYRLIQISSN